MSAVSSIGPAAGELAAATDCYYRYLSPAELYDFDIGRLDRLGLSVVVAALRAPDGFSNDGFGYGADYDEARVGALGEMSETFHVHRALERAPACESLSYNDMIARADEAVVIDPLTLCLPAGSDYTADTPLRWVQGVRWPDQARAWVPRETLAPGGPSYATESDAVLARGDRTPERLFTPITCGLGAGLSIEQALAHGVLERLQRDGNCTRFRAMDRGIDIDLDSVTDPGIRGILGRLAGQGVHVRAKLAATDFGLTNLYVIGEPQGPAAADDFPLTLTACGEAVHANAERALRKALLEYVAARIRKTFMHGPLARLREVVPAAYAETIMREADPADEEARAVREMAGWLELEAAELRAVLDDSVFAARETRPLSALPSIDDAAVREPADRLRDLTGRLGEQGFGIYYLDATPVGADAPRVIKAVVPGLEGETLSYHQIGERGVARLRDEAPELVAVGAPRPGDLRVALTKAALARLGGPAFFSPAAADTIVGRRYPLYREPGSHTAQKFRGQR